MPTNSELARIAVHACLTDLRERQGFQQLIASIPDWAACEHACAVRVERALEAENPEKSYIQEDLDLA
jgi:hypothetical protein